MSWLIENNIVKSKHGHLGYMAECSACGTIIFQKKSIVESDKLKPCVCQYRKGITTKRLSKYNYEVGDIVRDWEIVSKTQNAWGQAIVECKCRLCERTQPLRYSEISSGRDCLCQRKEKIVESLSTKYGVTNPYQLESVREKLREPSIQKRARETREETNLEKYGVKNYNLLTEARRDLAKYPLSDGTTLGELAEKYKANYLVVRMIYRRNGGGIIGERVVREWVENIHKGVSSLEVSFKNLIPFAERWGKKITKDAEDLRPDFKITEKLFVECDGLYYHCEKNRDRMYHVKRRKYLESLGIQLLFFRSDEILQKPEIVKSIVLSKVNSSVHSIAARKCVIKKVTRKEGREFLTENHLMGPDGISSSFGLYYKDSLVALMTTITKEGKTEISRFCPKLFTNVQGGFSRLLKHVIKELTPESVFSFCDLRYGDGHSYAKCGFTLVSETVSFKWTDGISTFHRRRCTANMDERGLSEEEHAEELGWQRVWDAGQRKYVLELNS